MALSTKTALQTPPITPSPQKVSLTAEPSLPLPVFHHPPSEPKKKASSPTSSARQVRQDEETNPDSRVFGNEEPKPITMPENPFDNEQSRIMFEAIDQLHSLGPNDLDPPQLVIVGGQSAGKSSLLQTLTGIPFPVDSGCCTRFPTRIVSKRTPGGKDSYRIVITPAEVSVKGIPPAPKRCLKYERTGEILSAELFVKIMEEVSGQLGIRRGTGADKRNFASEVLRVELSGPNRSYFEILDLPGHFTYVVDVNQEDTGRVTKMITQYLGQEANIVVCVADAATDMALQPIVGLVNENASKERTIGVFTKCDMVKNNRPAADRAVEVGLGGTGNEDLVLPSGWFFVKNKLPKGSGEDKLTEEKLFRAEPWNQIHKDRLGSAALKNYLSMVLNSKIRDCFPHLRQRVLGKLEVIHQELNVMGPPRDSHAQRQSWVTIIAQSFKEQVDSCLSQNGYQEKALRVLSKESKVTAEYQAAMRQFGGHWNFEEDDISPQTPPQPNQTKFHKISVDDLKVETPEELISCIKRELHEFSVAQLPGIVNPELYHRMYKLQVEKWPRILDRYLYQIGSLVKNCLEQILDRVCPPKGTTKRLHEQLHASIYECFLIAFEELQKKCNDACSKHTEGGKLVPVTGGIFEENLQKRREQRFIRIGNSINGQERESNEVLREYFQKTHWSTQDNMANEVHDVLKGYYEIQLNHFIQAIIVDVSEFVSGPQSPLKWLTPRQIIGFSEEEIARLGSEDDVTLNRRKELGQELEMKMGALRIVDEATEKTRALKMN